jgi:SAM-dependent methyltransferase
VRSHKKHGYIGLDSIQLDGVDFVIDLEIDNLPFPDASVDEANASHFLEHIRNLFHVTDEVYRVLKPGGIFTIEVPLFPYTGAIKDPTHVRFFIPETFDYLDNAWNYPGRPDYGNKKIRRYKKRNRRQVAVFSN